MQGQERIAVGDIVVQRIIDMEYPFLPPTSFFAEATPDNLAPHRHWLEPHALCPTTGKFILSFQSYLVRTTRRTVLIDTCIGCGKSETWLPEWLGRQDFSWLERLRSAGVHPEEVNYVFCTHLHMDHVGWNTQLLDGRWVPTFPNATYIFGDEEYAYCRNQNESDFRESVEPIVEAGQALLVKTDFALDDEIWLEPAVGHTPGHVVVHLASQGEEAVMCGDLMHSPVQCAHPDWSPIFDWDQALSRATRRRFLERQCADNRLVLTAHFPSPSVGHLCAHEGAFRFKCQAP